MVNTILRFALHIFLRIPLSIRTVLCYLVVFPIVLPVWILSMIKHGQVKAVLSELFSALLAGSLNDSSDIMPLEPTLSEKIKQFATELSIAGYRAYTKGQKGKPLMLFLHGFPDSWWSWHHQMEAFCDSYYCVAMCIPGYAGEGYKTPTSFTTANLAIEVATFVSLLKYKKATIVAHDWGGGLAWRLTASFPTMVDRLIIMDCPHHKLLVDNMSFDQALKSFYFLLFQIPIIPELYMKSNHFKFIHRLVTFDRPIGSEITNDDIRIMQYHMAQRGVLTNAFNYYRYMFSATAAEWEVYERTIEVPVLVLWGSNDAALRPDLNKGLKSVCPNSQLHVLEGATHWIPSERPAEVTMYMNQFLSKF